MIKRRPSSVSTITCSSSFPRSKPRSTKPSLVLTVTAIAFSSSFFSSSLSLNGVDHAFRMEDGRRSNCSFLNWVSRAFFRLAASALRFFSAAFRFASSAFFLVSSSFFLASSSCFFFSSSVSSFFSSSLVSSASSASASPSASASASSSFSAGSSVAGLRTIAENPIDVGDAGVNCAAGCWAKRQEAKKHNHTRIVSGKKVGLLFMVRPLKSLFRR